MDDRWLLIVTLAKMRMSLFGSVNEAVRDAVPFPFFDTGTSGAITTDRGS